MASRSGQTRRYARRQTDKNRGPNPPSSVRNMCGCVLTTANFGTAALPDIDRAVLGDVNRAVIDAHTFLIPSACHPTARRRLPSMSTQICYRRHSFHQQRNRGTIWIWNRGPCRHCHVRYQKPAYLAASGPIGIVPACDPATGLLQGTGAKRVVPQ